MGKRASIMQWIFFCNGLVALTKSILLHCPFTLHNVHKMGKQKMLLLIRTISIKLLSRIMLKKKKKQPFRPDQLFQKVYSEWRGMICLAVPKSIQSSFYLLSSDQKYIRSRFISPHVAIPSTLHNTGISVARQVKLNSTMISGDVGNSNKMRFYEIETIK